MASSYDPSSKIPFEHYAPQYRCCCDSVHVKQGTQIIGVIQAVCAIFSFIHFVERAFTQSYGAMEWFEILSFIGEVVVLSCLFMAIRKQNHRLLLPYLVYESLMVLLMFITIIGGIATFVNPKNAIGTYFAHLIDVSAENNPPDHKLDEETLIKFVVAFLIIVLVIASIIGIWFLHVVYKCFVYLRDLNRTRESNDLSMRYKPTINFA